LVPKCIAKSRKNKGEARSIVRIETYTEKRTLACANQSTIDDRKKWMIWWGGEDKEMSLTTGELQISRRDDQNLISLLCFPPVSFTSIYYDYLIPFLEGKFVRVSSLISIECNSLD